MEINVLGWIGLILSTPSIYALARLLIRYVLAKCGVREKVSLTYTDINNKTYKKDIYLSDDALLKIIDDIATKKKSESKETISHG